MFRFLSAFVKDRSGTSVILLALSLPALMVAVGGGIDITRAAVLRQQAANSAEVACQKFAVEYTFAAKSGKFLSYADLDRTVNDQLTRDSVTGVASNGSFIDFTKKDLTIVVKYDGYSPNMFGGVLGYDRVQVGVRRQCLAMVASAPPTYNNAGDVLFVESFETGHSVPSNSWGVLKDWNGWKTRDAGIEINGMPSLSGNVIRFGNFFAELDSHCYVANCDSNSTMSREMDLPKGDYEIRYWYISRIKNNLSDYANKVICGRESDVSWATWEDQTNRIELYIEKPGTWSTSSKFKAADMFDVCVYSDQWTERRIPFSVSKAGKHRISWRAAGKQDTVGGLIDYLRVCTKTCP